MNIPIIRLEIEGMRYQIATALAQHSFELGEGIQRAVAEFCTEENIDKVVNTLVNEQIKKTVQDEVTAFFSYGKGRTAVKSAVEEIMRSVFDEGE